MTENLLLECTEGPWSKKIARDVMRWFEPGDGYLANTELAAHSYDHALLLWAVNNSHARVYHGIVNTYGNGGEITAAYETCDTNPFGCPILTDELRTALLDLLRQEST